MRSEPIAPDPLLSIRQLAARQGLGEREIRRYIARGLPCYRMAGAQMKNVKIRQSEFLDWIKARRQG